MATPRECLCCCEVEQITTKMGEDRIDEQCITLHPGFDAVCLNIWVLQASYYNYHQHYGTGDLPHSINE